jgi:hypothetical protein
MDAMEKRKINLREAWSGCVTPEDYEKHMAAIGQARRTPGCAHRRNGDGPTGGESAGDDSGGIAFANSAREYMRRN